MITSRSRMAPSITAPSALFMASCSSFTSPASTSRLDPMMSATSTSPGPHLPMAMYSGSSTPPGFSATRSARTGRNRRVTARAANRCLPGVRLRSPSHTLSGQPKWRTAPYTVAPGIDLRPSRTSCGTCFGCMSNIGMFTSRANETGYAAPCQMATGATARNAARPGR